MNDELVKRARDCANGIGSFKSDKGDFGLLDDLADRIEALEAAIKRQSGAAATLRAITLAEVQDLKNMDRSEYNAAKTLDSERDANAILTAQVEALEAALAKADAVSDALESLMNEAEVYERFNLNEDTAALTAYRKAREATR